MLGFPCLSVSWIILLPGNQTVGVKLSLKISGELPAPEDQGALKTQITTDVRVGPWIVSPSSDPLSSFVQTVSYNLQFIINCKHALKLLNLQFRQFPLSVECCVWKHTWIP